MGEAGRQMKCRERGRIASRYASYKPRAKGWVTTQSDVPSSESCPPIESQPHPARLLGPEAVSFARLVQHGLEPCTATQPPPPPTPRPPSCHVLVTGRGLRHSHTPIRGIPGKTLPVLPTRLAHPHGTRPKRPGPCSMPLLGGEPYRCGGARRRVMIFSVCWRCWWSRWWAFGERRLSKVRCCCKLARRFE